MPKAGELYLHFKNKIYQIITVAEHSETGEQMVVYQAMYGRFQTYVRPLAMFNSKVDTQKYPDCTQVYRFQKISSAQAESMLQPQVKKKKSEQFVREADETLQTQENTNDRFAQELVEQPPVSMEEESEQAAPQVTEPVQSWEAKENLQTADAPEEEGVNPHLLEFLDADTYAEKYRVLVRMEREVTDRLINDMAVVLDVVIPEGDLDERFRQLKSCVSTLRKYEVERPRNN